LVAELELADAKAVMIWARMRHHLRAELAHVDEEAARVADARDRVDRLAAPGLQRLPVARVAHAVRNFAFQPHFESMHVLRSEVGGLMRDNGLNGAQPPRRLAQRS